MSKLSVYNGKKWVEIAKNGKDAVVDYEKIIKEILDRVAVVEGPPGPPGKDGFIDEATIAYLEDRIDKLSDKHGKLSRHLQDGIGLVVRQLRAGSNITIDNSNQEYPIISATASGSGITVSVTEPVSPTLNDFWLDTSGVAQFLLDIGDGYSLNIGDGHNLAINTVTGTAALKYWNGSTWYPVN